MINIEEKTSEKVSGNTSLFITFDFKQEIVDILKQCDGFNYNKKNYIWELPIIYLSFLLEKLNPIDDITLKLTKTSQISAKINQVVKYKINPFEHQNEAIKYGLSNDKWLLLDAPGLGKTFSIIGLAEELKTQRNIEHCLIICGINSLKLNWEKEIEKTSNLDCVVIGKRINKNNNVVYTSVSERAEQLRHKIKEFFVILNVENLRDERIIDAINSGENHFDMMICDECHKVATASSEQGKGFLKLNAKYKIAATGTLITNSPLSCYVPLKWIDKEHSTLTNYKNTYCELGGRFSQFEIVGYKNLELLKDEIESCSLRRTKDLLNLPKKNIINEFIELDSKHFDFYNNVKKGIKEECDKVELKTNNLLSLITRMRQAIDCPSLLTSEKIDNQKLFRAKELIDEIVSNGEKVVVFSMFKEPIYQLKELLKDYDVLLGTGDLQDSQVSDNVDKFQNDDSKKIFLGTIQKLGTGLTLTKASYMIFLNCSWTSAQNLQAEDRIYRVGTEKPVFIYYLWAVNTIDEHIKELVENKAQLSDYIVDDKVSDTPTEMLKKILYNSL